MAKNKEKTRFAKTVNIKNRRASFEFSFLEKFVAGMVLQGTEIKSIREGKVALGDAHCYIKNDELFVKQMHIAQFSEAKHFNHEETRERKLLMHKREIKKLEKKLQEKGLTIVPIRLFISSKGFAKLEIALAKGKKLHDKRNDIKDKDLKRDMARMRY
ncbi:MAG: SsrA-binding protein SmpB [Cytophagales bacterium]|nr:SsrA-binding protein SmpB [Cytophagales bacterium]